MIPFGEWCPDSPELGPQAREALGVIPEADGYRPFKALATVSNALTARAQGAAWFRAPDGSTKNFAGDATKLYLLSSATWSDVSRASGGAYATGSDGNWRFAQFQTKAYATNFVDDLQSFDLASGTNWVAAAGSPPKAKYIGVVGSFLVVAHVSGSPMQTKWSGLNNSGTWTPSATTLADEEDHPDGGEITGFVGGRAGLVFQEEAIRSMTFEGSPTVFRFDKIAENIGATIPNSVAAWGNLAFFCHRSGFYMVRDAQQVIPIGRGEDGSSKIDRWFWGKIDQTNLHRLTAAYDPVNSLYIVSFPADSSSGTPNMMLIYSIRSNRWSRAEATCEMIYSGATQQSYTLEQLDAFGTLETLPYSLDSSYWTGSRQLLLSGFYTDHKYGAFSGANVAATLHTGEVQPLKGLRGRIRSVRPMIDGGTPTMMVGVRETLQDSVIWTGERSQTRAGDVPFNVSGRYARFCMKQPAGAIWQWAQGIDDPDVRQAGLR